MIIDHVVNSACDTYPAVYQAKIHAPQTNISGGRANIREIYAPQTKNLEGRASIRERIFKALFTYVSTRFGLRSFEKCFENTFPNVCSAFQILRLGSIKLFSKNFSNERRPNRVLTYVKSALKIRSRMFARHSKIFVWGA
jgi:hypothetical protein